MSKNEIVRSGGCLCGAVRYEAKGESYEITICHCTRCQRWSGSAFMAGAGFTTDTVVWNKDPTFFALDDTCNRSFCPKCGSSLGFHYSGGQVWITLGSLDDPEQLKPQSHQFTEKELSWAHLDDVLPRHDQAPSEWENN